MLRSKTTQAAKGKWRGILLQLGVPAKALSGRHTACPLCGGRDRFRWDNQEGSGSYICGQCGAGSGMGLAMKFTGQDFKATAAQIDALLGTVRHEPIPQGPSPAQIRAKLRETYGLSAPIQPGDGAQTYLATRGIVERHFYKTLRFAEALKDGEGGVHPCLLAQVQDVAGQPCTLHRTFLSRDGSGKAAISAPRKLMTGLHSPLPAGACVRLSDVTPGMALGLAEGLETALAASILFDMPVWAALNTSLLKKWQPPEDLEGGELVIFADNDPQHGGQAAAWALAHKLAVQGHRVQVKIPDQPGQDWNDVLLSQQRQRSRAAGAPSFDQAA